MTEMSTNMLALEFLTEIRDALKRGTKHYNKAGKLLVTEKQIVATLLKEGQIKFEPVK